MLKIFSAALLLTALTVPATALDFGVSVEKMLADQSVALFGVGAPLAASAEASAEQGYRTKDQNAGDQVALAAGLSATYLTRDAGNKLDMMALYPAANPTHLIACIEGGREEIAAGKWNPSIQSIALADGKVTTLVRGMDRCDGIRATAWGTIFATEETDDGGAYEIIDPLAIENVVVTDRATGEVSDPEHVVKRTALPVIAWEGLVLTADGVLYGGDELRPGDDAADADGGAMFKFVPAKAHSGTEPIAALDASPLAAGKTYALQISCQGNKIQFGQGCEVGKGNWVEIDPAKARADADKKGATGYYRPEDLHDDLSYTGEGIRMCGANTGNEKAANYGEVICITDLAPSETPQVDAEGKIAFTTEVNRFVEGDTDFNSLDNLAFQGKTGILYVIEDHDNGDIFACLPDGDDRDIKTDGCIKILSVKDSSAEPTGFMFSDDGMTAYLSIQHSDDSAMEKVDDYGTDDLLVITGFKAPAAM